MIQKLQTNDGSRNKAELGWIFLIDIVAAKFCTWKGIFPERHHPAIYGSSIGISWNYLPSRNQNPPFIDDIHLPINTSMHRGFHLSCLNT
jgi:hypothetical protein